MSENKRYYWLKLADDFFTSKRIKKLRKLAGGDTFTIIYLKMQLLSINTGGILTYTGLEKTFEEELALDIDEDTENVRITISYLMSCGLLELKDSCEYFLPYAIECTGSETASTRRSKKSRNLGTSCGKTLQCNTNATPMQRLCNGEKEKEKEKDIEIDKEIEKDKKKVAKATKEKQVFFADEKLNQTFLDYLEMKRKSKKPVTDRAIQIAINKINQYCQLPFSDEIDTEKAIKVVEQSILSGWQGIFDLKETSSKKSFEDAWRDA